MKAAKSHPKYKSLRYALAGLSNAVRVQHEWARRLSFSPGDDTVADEFVSAHLTMRRLQKRVYLLRMEIARDTDLPIDSIYRLK